jgi:hypothetical protein
VCKKKFTAGLFSIASSNRESKVSNLVESYRCAGLCWLRLEHLADASHTSVVAAKADKEAYNRHMSKTLATHPFHIH